MQWEEKNKIKNCKENIGGPQELTYESYGSGNIWSGDLSAYAILISNPVDQLNGYAGSTEGIYIRHSFPMITFFPVTNNNIMRLVRWNILESRNPFIYHS